MTKRRTKKSPAKAATPKKSAAPAPKKTTASSASNASTASKLKASEQVKATVAAEANARRTNPGPVKGATKGKNSRTPDRPQARPEATITISQDEIAERAYLLWLAKGRPQGQDETNWLEAEAELVGSLTHA